MAISSRHRPSAALSGALGATMIVIGTSCDPRILEAVELIPRAEAGAAPEGGPIIEAGPPGEAGPRDGSSREDAPAIDDGSSESGPIVDSGTRADGSIDSGGGLDGGATADGTFDTGRGVDAACTPDAPTGLTSWPNCVSSANSDAWLAQHHDQLTAIRPRLLILQFYNAWSTAQAESGAQPLMNAMREGSRYHGYSKASAPAFLEYEIARTVDFTDHPPPPPPTWTNPSSTRLPVTASGDFDTAALFTQKFADDMGAQGFPDPTSSRNLTLCEIFERGLINEAWLVVGESGRRRPPLMLERKQVYDAAGNPIAGNFVCVKGGTCVPEINCRATVRLAHLDPTRGAGCDLDVRGWNIENMRSAIPYLDTNLRAFFNADFKARFNAPFDSFDEICDRNNTQCVSYPTPTQASGTRNGVTWTINPFTQGCGTPEFPPNARWRYDWTNKGQVQARCEHYGMRDGDGGQDAPDLYSFDKAATYDDMFGKSDCGTGWQVYWRQSLPGLGTTAVDADGKRMKNFWPFLFY